MTTKLIDIKTKDGICDSFIAYPEAQGRYPAVLLFMDAFGLREHMYDMARTLAAQGYYVLIPNLLYRIRRAPVVDIQFPLKAEDMPDVRNKMMPIFQNLNPQTTMDDMPAFLDFLSSQPQVKPGKIGITGYCMGGALAIRAAALFPERIAVAASFHAGRLATDDDNSPHKLLNRIKARLYVAHADNDSSMPPEQIERFHQALTTSEVKGEDELYKGAAHGFTMKDLPAYNQVADERHWKKLFELLKNV